MAPRAQASRKHHPAVAGELSVVHPFNREKQRDIALLGFGSGLLGHRSVLTNLIMSEFYEETQVAGKEAEGEIYSVGKKIRCVG